MQVASYAKQWSSGSPLIIDKIIDKAAVKYLAYFDIVVLHATPFACDVDGDAKGEIPLLLRKYNPNIKIFLYLGVENQWLPPKTLIRPDDHSAYAKIYYAIDLTDGWLYNIDGTQWIDNYRVNLGKELTMSTLINAYIPLITTHLFDGVFLDCCSPSIAWTDNESRRLDYQRAGFNSLAEMDIARLNNINYLILMLKQVGGSDFKVALNGVGPKPNGVDIDFREGYLSLITHDDAIAWMKTPGAHWLKAEGYNDAELLMLSNALREIAQFNPESIVSCGPNENWPPYQIIKGS